MRFHFHLISVELLLMSVAVSSCVATPKKPEAPVVAVSTPGNIELGKTPEIKSESNLPLRFEAQPRDLAGVENLLIGFELVDSAQTVRPRTEIRTGPGVEFELVDDVLRSGERVLVYELVGSWRRIVSPARGIRGWAHRGTLRFDRHGPKKKAMEELNVKIQPNLLPLVFANREINQVFRFSTLAPMSTAIPRGRSFHLLKELDGRKLIWLSETNSVVWVRSEEMK